MNGVVATATFEGWAMGESEFRQKLPNGKGTDRVIFAVALDLKSAVAEMTKQDCMSASSFISALLAEEVARRAMR